MPLGIKKKISSFFLMQDSEARVSFIAKASIIPFVMKDGILLLDKEEGMTSRKVDNLIAKKFLNKKVGHLGTLDPFATGLLLVAVGKATKFLPYLDSSYKTYVAKLVLGKKTDTGDLTGNFIETAEIPSLDKTSIEEVFAGFLGLSYQLPPMTSAIKIDGVPLYKLAHKGKTKEREKRQIEIKELSCLELGKDSIVFKAKVSSGTYIRTLGEDIAEKLGSVGYLESLRRVEVGSISVSRAKRLDELTEDDFLSPSPFVNLERIPLDEKQILDAKNGKKILLPQAISDEIVLMDKEEAVAVYSREKGSLYASKRGLF